MGDISDKIDKLSDEMKKLSTEQTHGRLKLLTIAEKEKTKAYKDEDYLRRKNSCAKL